MNFFGVGGLEFLLIFGVAMFFLGPKRLAQGVRTGRKYYTELKRYRQELTSLVTEAIDAEDLKADLERAKSELEQTKKEAWDESATKAITGIDEDVALDQRDIDFLRPVSTNPTSTKAKAVDRGDGKVAGTAVPSIGLESTESNPVPEAEPDAEPEGSR